jgi:prepilin-type N-terminal cleavage/methylation domain-containing protein
MPVSRGFSLIELVAVIVVVSIAVALYAPAFVELPRGLNVDENAQTASQLAQACGEHVLALRRGSGGYAAVAVGSSYCTGLPTVTGYTVADATVPYVGTACPATCKQTTVTVTYGTATPAQTTLMLVNY